MGWMILVRGRTRDRLRPTVNALDLGYLVAAGVLSPVWMQKARGGWGERLGKVDGETAARLGGARSRPRVLIHAVSVGEVSALRSLVPMLAQDLDVVVSATTDTGIARARALYGESATVVRYPLDLSWAVRRFLDVVQPDAVALTELELWPNFLRACGDRGIPVGVINGRLSERSFRNYHKLRGAVGGMFRRLEFAAVQDEAYATRFEAMGVQPERCLLTGSMKWDNARVGDGAAGAGVRAGELAQNLGLDRSRPIVVCGSTGPGEEALLRGAIEGACGGLGVQLVCAPRKPERFDEAAEVLSPCVRRSVTEAGEAGAPGQDRFLLDTIGELGTLYALADVVVVGRSFGDLYGSDPTEPIGLGKATVIGPRVGDFESIVAAFEAGGGIVRATREDVGVVVRGLLEDTGRRAELGECGRAVILGQQGASERHAGLIRGLVARRGVGGTQGASGPTLAASRA
jgi:3-deoxy-D-manno-octulosonic-acid transferase